jgi:hypothetical protein
MFFRRVIRFLYGFLKNTSAHSFPLKNVCPFPAGWARRVCPPPTGKPRAGPHTLRRGEKRASPSSLVGSTSIAHFPNLSPRAHVSTNSHGARHQNLLGRRCFLSGASSPSPRTTHTHRRSSPPRRVASSAAGRLTCPRPAPLHYLAISASRIPSAFPIQPSTEIAGTAGVIKKGKKQNNHRIAASPATTERGEGAKAAKGSIKRRGGDEACRPTPSNLSPSPPMPASRS